MQDRPNKAALLAAVARFLSEEARPALSDPRLAFRALIAANLATIVASEAAREEDDVTAELASVRSVLGETSIRPSHRAEDRRADLAAANERLARLLREGAPSPDEWGLIRNHLMTALRAKLAVDNPRFDTALVIEPSTSS